MILCVHEGVGGMWENENSPYLQGIELVIDTSGKIPLTFLSVFLVVTLTPEVQNTGLCNLLYSLDGVHAL